MLPSLRISSCPNRFDICSMHPTPCGQWSPPANSQRSSPGNHQGPPHKDPLLDPPRDSPRAIPPRDPPWISSRDPPEGPPRDLPQETFRDPPRDPTQGSQRDPPGFSPPGISPGIPPGTPGILPSDFPQRTSQGPPQPSPPLPPMGDGRKRAHVQSYLFPCTSTALRCAALHRTAHCTERTALPRIACTVRGCRADLSAHLFSHLTCGRRTRPSPVAARPTHQSTQPPIHPPVHPPIRRSTNPPPPQLMTAWL